MGDRLRKLFRRPAVEAKLEVSAGKENARADRELPTAEEVGWLREWMRRNTLSIKECLAHKKANPDAMSTWKDDALVILGDTALTGAVDAATYAWQWGAIQQFGSDVWNSPHDLGQAGRNAWERVNYGYRKEAAAVNTDLGMDIGFTLVADTALFASQRRWRGRESVGTFVADLGFYNLVYFLKRGIDMKTFEAQIEEQRKDLSPEERAKYVQERLYFNLTWQLMMGTVTPTVFKWLGGTSCLLPRSFWFGALKKKHRFLGSAAQATMTTAVTAGYLVLRRQMISELPPLPKDGSGTDENGRSPAGAPPKAPPPAVPAVAPVQPVAQNRDLAPPAAQ